MASYVSFSILHRRAPGQLQSPQSNDVRRRCIDSGMKTLVLLANLRDRNWALLSMMQQKAP
eukprot:207371-Amphidinium_carterae.1